MWHGRPASRGGAALALALLALTPGAHAQGPTEAADVAYAAAAAGAEACGRLAVERDTAVATPTPSTRVTQFRPPGFDVKVRGTEAQVAQTLSFESRWLVAGNEAFPQNIEAARLAQGCRDADIAPAQPLDWHRLSYLEPATGDIRVGSGPAWSGAAVVAPLLPFTGTGSRLLDPQAPIWAPGCTKGPQTVRFSRTLHLLGPPASLSVGIGNESRGVTGWPFSSLSMRINGATVLRRSAPGSAAQDLPLGVLRTIKTGENRIDVIVAKKRTGACNGRRGSRQIAVSIALAGEHAWNLSVTRPPPRDFVGAVTPADVAVPYTIANAGPSALLEPVLVVDTTFSRPVRSETLVLTPDGQPEQVCNSFQEATTSTFRTVCGTSPLGPGESRTLPIATIGRPVDPQPPYLVTWTTSWDFHGTGGLAPGSLCVPPAGQPDCSTLRP